jgi:hypothetical protein
MVKFYSGRATPAEFIAGLFRQRGIEVNRDRLEDRVLAERSRRKFDADQHIDKVRALASAVKRARRATEVAELAWRIEPNSATLQEARQAQQARTAAENELREQLLGDQDLFADVMRSVGR